MRNKNRMRSKKSYKYPNCNEIARMRSPIINNKHKNQFILHILIAPKSYRMIKTFSISFLKTKQKYLLQRVNKGMLKNTVHKIDSILASM